MNKVQKDRTKITCLSVLSRLFIRGGWSWNEHFCIKAPCPHKIVQVRLQRFNPFVKYLIQKKHYGYKSETLEPVACYKQAPS